MYKEFISQDGKVVLDEFGKFLRWNTSSIPPHIEREGYFFHNLEEYPYE